MRRLIVLLLCLAVPSVTIAQSSAITRHDGFVLIWDSLHRPAPDVRETQYSDIAKSDDAYQKILYAKSRNILGDVQDFRPNDPLTLADALVWLFRTRNVDDPDKITVDTLSGFLARYPIARIIVSSVSGGRVFIAPKSSVLVSGCSGGRIWQNYRTFHPCARTSA